MNTRMTTASICKRVAALALALICVGIGSMAWARPVGSDNSDNSGAQEIAATQPASSVLQVTGTTNNFNISAQHADVQTVLKLVFEQAHRQFVPDASVSGDVTLYLTNQRFDTVLASICTQAVLRYEVDKNGIYQIHRDNDRLIALIQSRRVINSLLAEQLRNMGYDASAFAAKPADKQPGAAGGFGGRGAPAAAKRSAPLSENQAGSRANRSSIDSPAGPVAASPLLEGGPNGPQNSPALRDMNMNGTVNLNDPTQYQAFLKQFRMVSINTKGVELPVRDLLQDVARQAGIGIYIDPSVPTGNDFVLKGFITPRPLANLLSILCYNGHLEWQLVNGRIYVTATPQFQLLLKNMPLTSPPSSGK